MVLNLAPARQNIMWLQGGGMKEGALGGGHGTQKQTQGTVTNSSEHH